jgi:hypothetical protein
MIEEIRNDVFIKKLSSKNILVERFPNIEGKNELLIIKKYL